MVAWANGLMAASERRQAPSWWLLPLMSLWANLHGGFVFGLVLVGAFAFDAVWNAEPSQRRPLAVRWFVFGVGALAACCVTPYGWGSILAARRILDPGRVVAPHQRMDAGGLQQSRSVRAVDTRHDRGRALWRRNAVAAADRAGAGPVAHGAFARQERRDICAAAADRRAWARVIAVRLAAGLAWQGGGPDCFNGHARWQCSASRPG